MSNKELKDTLKIFQDNINAMINDGTVICDYCGKDYTHSSETGGFTFESTVVCPSCAPSFEAKVIKNNESEYIKYRCPPDQSFVSWVRNFLRKEHLEEHTYNLIVIPNSDQQSK